MFSLIIYNLHHPDLACPQPLPGGVAGVGPGLLLSVGLPAAPRHHVAKVQQFVLQSDLDKVLLGYLAILISYF